MSHHCQALVISCMDFRLHQPLHAWADERYPEGYDLVHLAGGAGALLKEDTAATVLKQIELSQKLHEAKEVVLVNHLDCGAYGGRAAFASDEEEHETHERELREAASLISKRWPGLMTIEAIEHLDGTVELLQ